jgi:hypothetical protein
MSLAPPSRVALDLPRTAGWPRWAAAFWLAINAGCSSRGSGEGLASDAMDAMTASPKDGGEVEPAGEDATELFTGADSAADTEACQPGTYAGTYQGTNDSSATGGPKAFPIAGPLTIRLVPSTQQGEIATLVTDHGTFDATWGGFGTGDAAAGLIVVHADLTGQLDCGSHAFMSTSTDGGWTFLTVPQGSATLDFDGTYDASTRTIAGNFTILSGTSSSTGTWSVTYQPPLVASDP